MKYTNNRTILGSKIIANFFAGILHFLQVKLHILQGKSELSNNIKQHPLPILKEHPLIDILVATMNRKDELPRLLLSLRKQSYSNFRVIIANQNNVEYLADIIKDFCDLTIISIVVPPRGVSAARNAIIPLSDGDIVAFPDDDCWYEKDTLEQVVNIFREHANAGTLLGIHEEAKPNAKQILKKLSSYGCFFDSGTIVQFFRQEIIALTGKFDIMLGPGTGLPYGCGEDTDYIFRAHASNYAVLRTSNVRIHHALPDITILNKQKIQAYAYGRLYLLHKSKLPHWFTLCNILYPLICLPIDTWKNKANGARYRWIMFTSRCKAYFSIYFRHTHIK